MLMNDAGQAIAVLGVCATVAITVVTIGRAYVRGIELQKKPSHQDLTPDAKDRMSRIEQAVDAIAIEVERMSEGQRFTTRLLAERFGEHGRPVQGDAAQPVTRRSGEQRASGGGGSNGR